jgi:hypothetical protein
LVPAVILTLLLEESKAQNDVSQLPDYGLWVHTGKLPRGFDIVQAIRDDRESPRHETR